LNFCIRYNSVKEEKRIASIRKELEVLKAKVAVREGEREVRMMLRSLREVWMEVGIKKLKNHKGVTVKALLDSRATRFFVEKKFVKEYSFKLEKLDRPIEVKNIDGTSNSGRRITYELKCNMFYKGHSERLRIDVCNLERIKMILGMPLLAAHNPKINWETREIKMLRYLSWCGRKVAVKQRKAREEDKKDLRWTTEDKERKVEARKDRRKVEDMVLRWFHKWLKVFGKQDSERMPVQKPWDYAIDL